MRYKGLAAAAVMLASVGIAGCGAGDDGSSSSGDSGSSTRGKTIKVLMVNNPQMVDIQKLTADNFTKDTGIKVQFKVLPENDLRDTVTQDVSNGAGQYDAVTTSNYEIPFYSKNGWLASLDDYVAKDTEFDQGDILKPMADAQKGEDGKLYGQPFYGESSMLMYRKDLFKKAGITVPDQPTWQQVADWAQKLDTSKTSGICLRGLPGWGEVWAPLNTVVNTFGGTWFDEGWNTKVTDPAFKEAVNFYVDLVKKYGEKGAAQSGFTECLNNLSQGKSAMWYDATSAAGSLEDAKESPNAGKFGYAKAPVNKTKTSGWLYSWSWGIEETTKNKDAAWEFVSWASSKKYEELVGSKLGWSRVPAGKRTSTYENADYQDSAKAFYKITEEAIQTADPANPGTQKRPYAGIQFLGIPEWTSLGTDASREISSAIAGRQSVDAAITKIKPLADKVGADNK